MDKPIHIKTIREYHKLRALPEPKHPLVSVINFESLQHWPGKSAMSLIHNFYSIALKRTNAKLKYGQQEYDFDSGVMAFLAPNQVLRISVDSKEELIQSGWILLVHPDFVWNTSLANKIKQFDFFGYNNSEALHLSEQEEETIITILKNINKEYSSAIDQYTQGVIIAQIELLLTYSERFYNRQFITRKKTNHSILTKLEILLDQYFKADTVLQMGQPTVEYVSQQLNISPNYLSQLLKNLTGQSTKQFIQDKLIEMAKEKLSTTDLTVSEVAYALGFDYPQSFNKLFKAQTGLTPMKFRDSFN